MEGDGSAMRAWNVWHARAMPRISWRQEARNMTTNNRWRDVLIAVLIACGPIAAAQQPGIDWPAFRGIDANGVSDGRATPTTFAPAGALWKTPIAGLGHSSPVIWGNRLCVTTAISGQQNAGLKIGTYGDIASVNDATPHEWKVLCLDKRTGAVQWEKSV